MSMIQDYLARFKADQADRVAMQEHVNQSLSGHDKHRLNNAFRDFLPFVSKQQPKLKPLLVRTPEKLFEDGNKVGTLKTWKENSDETIVVEEVEFFTLFDVNTRETMLYMPIPRVEEPQEDGGWTENAYCLALPVFADNPLYMFLPQVEKNFLKEFIEKTRENYYQYIENGMMQVLVYAPPPAILEDFNVLSAFNRGTPFSIENHCFDPAAESENGGFVDWGIDIFYCANIDNTGAQVIEACVEISRRVWIFIELKPEFAFKQ